MDRSGVERWFLRRGLPHLIHDYRATEDVYTRAAPLLLVVFLLSSVGALRSDWSVTANAAAVIGGLFVLVGIIALVNRLRGRRPLQRPSSVGVIELSVFVLGPPLMVLVVSGNALGALAALVVLVTVLAVISVGASFGAVPMVRWGVGQAIRQVGDVANLVIRTLPILLIFSAFLFINAEIWQVSSDLSTTGLLVVVAIMVGLGLAFLLFRIPRVVGQIAVFGDVDEVRSCLPADVDLPDGGELDLDAPLGRNARWNVGLVLTVSQGLQILLATLAIFGFYVLFGVAAVGEATIGHWVVGGIEEVDVIQRFDLLGQERVLTAVHLHAAAFIGAFGGLHVTVAALTDATYREEFAEEVIADVRSALAVRLVYLSALVR